jgi:NADH-quinone oxidoreductase subunit N
MKLKDFTFEGFNGLARREPLAAAATLVFLFSLAGIPGTAGFMAKFYLLAATMEQGGTLWLIILAVLCAAISVYYYFRVVQAMYFKSPEETAVLPLSTGFRVLLILLALLVVFLGVFPQLLIDQIYMIF